jgi:hypothetical protein
MMLQSYNPGLNILTWAFYVAKILNETIIIHRIAKIIWIDYISLVCLNYKYVQTKRRMNN